MPSLMKIFATSIFIVLFVFACASKKPIRNLKEIKKVYNGSQVYSIDYLLSASIFDNRDIVASSIYHLGKILYDFENKPKKWKFKVPAEKKVVKEKIVDQLLKVYAINEDFNLKLLVLEALTWEKSQPVCDLYLASLEDSDPIIIKKSLIKLRDYILDDSFEVKDLLDRTQTLLKHPNKQLALIAIDTLFIFSPNLKILEVFDETISHYASDRFMQAILKEKKVRYQDYLKTKS